MLKCDICKFLVPYTNNTECCCRYPQEKVIEKPSNHSCGEHEVDWGDIRRKHDHAVWVLERKIIDIRSARREQVAGLRSKYKKLKTEHVEAVEIHALLRAKHLKLRKECNDKPVCSERR